MSRILVVDDNALNLRLACITLELAGHETLVAANGREAVEVAESELPDMILMDLRMPVMDGNSAMKHIKADARMRNIPVVALTASAMKGEREQLLANGFDGYIDKPIDVNTFAGTVAGFLPRIR
jgi:two-component system cell cycle response regulator DivK